MRRILFDERKKISHRHLLFGDEPIQSAPAFLPRRHQDVDERSGRDGNPAAVIELQRVRGEEQNIEDGDDHERSDFERCGRCARELEQQDNEHTVDDALALKPEAILMSPGPCAPDQAGICLDLIKTAPDDLPLLGVCLGHQAIGQAMGGDVIRA
jgi:hypothetical protein